MLNRRDNQLVADRQCENGISADIAGKLRIDGIDVPPVYRTKGIAG
jgi:hypothetical protein